MGRCRRSLGWRAHGRGRLVRGLSGILFICGDARHAQAVARDDGHGYWSAALPLVLEKHGVGGVRTAGPEALTDAELLRSAGAVLVATLPDGAWSQAALRSLTGSGAEVLVEGPLDPALAAQLGLEAEAAGHEGTVTVGDPDLKARAVRHGADPGGKVAAATSRPVPREDEWAWQTIPEVPLSEAQARIWREPGWRASWWRDAGTGEVLATWTSREGAASPALVRAGTVSALSFGLFAYLGQSHTAEPVAAAEHRSSPRALGLEVLLLALLEQMHARAGRPLARLLPWPDGYRWALSVRHDFDRRLSLRRTHAVLRRHAAFGSAATWYWRARHLERRRLLSSRAVRAVAGTDRHEVALHTERVWRSGDAERARLERAAGQSIHGTSAHGDPGGFRWQGAPNVLWAHNQQLAYTELIQQAHVHPHRFASLSANGRVGPLDLICLPHHESLDRTSRGGDTADDDVLAAAELYSRAGGLLQVLNHPDINVEALFTLLTRLPTDGRWDVTAGQAADWWARTHAADRLRLSWASATRLRVASEAPVDGLVVEVRSPGGATERHVVALAAGGSVIVG